MKQYRYENRLAATNRVKRVIWNFTCALLFRPTPRWALHGWRRFLLRCFGSQVGEGCRIDPSAKIWAPWNLTMGDYVAIGENVDIYSVAHIRLGSKVTVSQRTFLCTASHDITTLKRPLTSAPIALEDHVWVAAEAMIYPGCLVREGSVIAARSVLRGNTEPWSIWAGHPAVRVGNRTLNQDLHDRRDGQ